MSTTSRGPPLILTANGVTMLSEELDYMGRRLRFFEGPEGIALELVEWVDLGGLGRGGTRWHDGAFS